MNGYRITVTYEFELDAPDYDSARQWAIEEVEHGHVIPSDVDVERMNRAAHGCTYPGHDAAASAAMSAILDVLPKGGDAA